MGEIKSVKVDNWGVFFLQKLQNFFNKTDYCDLTLQFNDNSQLKVHRLVLSACTEYFNILEKSSDVVDDTLHMPHDLQADVVVPIVNFMYTGTLEFEYVMYDRLFRTAREMNMTVLVKLLEAHRKTTPVQRPIIINKYIGKGQTTIRQIQQQNVETFGRPAATAERTYSSQYVRKTVQQAPPQRQQRQTKVVQHLPTNQSAAKSHSLPQFLPKINLPETIAIVSKYRPSDKAKGKGPSRFEPNEEESLMADSSFDTFNEISYESLPLMKADEREDYDDEDEQSSRPSTSAASTFEELRKGYTNPNKRAAMSITPSPPAKKPNLQDVKEYTEAARLRKQLEAAEMEDDPNYTYDDDTHFNDDDDDENTTTATYQLPTKQSPAQSGGATGTRIVTRGRPPKYQASVEEEGNSSQIIVKDSSGSVHHAQIISEVLKKYPHLVKNNKNIKLKIMQKSQSPQTTVTHTQVTTKLEIDKIKQEKSPVQKQFPMTVTKIKSEKLDKVVPGKQQITSPTAAAAAPTTSKPVPKRIDSKLMHALIAKGAENMTGPWLCLRCGIGGRPISIPSYKSFRRHLINVHKEKIDVRICEYCGFRVTKVSELPQHHMTAHGIKSSVELVGATKTLPPKMKQPVAKRDVQHCIYCNKVFSKELLLYNHMKTAHKQKAREDGVIDFSDDEQEFDEGEKYVPNDPNASSGSSGGDKIKILSNITIPPTKSTSTFVFEQSPGTVISQIGGTTAKTASTQISLEPSSEAEALSNVASGIATSLGLVDEAHFQTGEILTEQFISADGQTIVSSGDQQNIVTKLVTADGAELELTQSQKEEILSQLQGNTSNLENVVMVLNQDHSFEGGEIMSGNSGDSQNIVVVYSQADDVVATTSTTTTVVATKKSKEEPTKHDEVDEEMKSDQVVEEKQNEVVEEEEADSMDWQEKTLPDEGTDSMDKSENVEATADDSQKGEEEEEEEDTEATQQYAYDEEKMKLISELQGDWTEEEEEEQLVTPKSAEVKESKPAKSQDASASESTTATEETSTDVKTDEKDDKIATEDAKDNIIIIDTITGSSPSTKESIQKLSTKLVAKGKSIVPPSANVEKELSSILDEWYDDADEAAEEKKEKDECTVEKSDEKDIEETSPKSIQKDDSNGAKNEEETTTVQKDDSMEVDETVANDKKEDTSPDDEKCKTSQPAIEENSEIKTLINDWDDEDGDL